MELTVFSLEGAGNCAFGPFHAEKPPAENRMVGRLLEKHSGASARLSHPSGKEAV